ncbi:MAG: hypothetical protein QM346_18745 [Chloroflexota bacterium]|nr:hypothetical protein [Chloroflexota bacterium]
MAWAYDLRAHRYRDNETGRFLSQARARELIGESLRAAGDAGDELARLMAGGRMSPEDWRQRMREEIKGEVIRQYLLGRGGREQMTARDWGSVGGVISDQYRHLDRKAGNFFSLVEAGELEEGEIARRTRMYLNSAREGHERALLRRLTGSEYGEERWVTTAEESCDDCIDLALLGWVEIGTLPTRPGAGDTACLTNCACFVSYRNPDDGRVFGEDE